LLRKRFNKKPKNCFSCVEPPIYADRFYDFLSNNLFTEDRKFPSHEIEKTSAANQSPLGPSEGEGEEQEDKGKNIPKSRCIMF